MAEVAVPAIAIAIAWWRDRYDGKPDYVVPWVIFAAVVGTAWALPIPHIPSRRLNGAAVKIPRWVWPWVAFGGVVLFRR
jgi:hypothetical protein